MEHTAREHRNSDRATTTPLVTIAIPSLNQGQFLDDALTSVFSQEVPVEVFVADAGSTDNSLEVIHRWEHRLSGWRSHPDSGQAAAINEVIAFGKAPYVAWLNSDDAYLAGGLQTLIAGLEQHPEWPAAYGNAWNTDAALKCTSRVWVQAFSPWRMAQRCVISQPACLIRRSAWEAVQGLDESLHMALDYDLWWRLFRRFGPLGHIRQDVALNRDHDETKTRTQRRRHYQEAMAVVRTHYGSVPIKWWLAWPLSVWLRGHLVRQKPVPADGA
jgi:glycosyltransferase involved in cell wall biosynthesis